MPIWNIDHKVKFSAVWKHALVHITSITGTRACETWPKHRMFLIHEQRADSPLLQCTVFVK